MAACQDTHMRYFVAFVACVAQFVLLVIIFALLGAQKYASIFGAIYVASAILIWRSIVRAKFWHTMNASEPLRARSEDNAGPAPSAGTEPFRDPASSRMHPMNEHEKSFYTQAAQEVVTKRYETALMAKAYSDAEGDENKTSALYIRYRVVELREQHARSQVLASEREKQEQAAAADKLKRDSEISEAQRCREERDKEVRYDGSQTVCPKCRFAGRMRKVFWAATYVVSCPICSNRFQWYYVSSDKVRYLSKEETKKIIAERKLKIKEREAGERDLRRRLASERSKPIAHIYPAKAADGDSMTRLEFCILLGLVLLVVIAWIYFVWIAS